MSPEGQLQWEARAGRLVAACAIASALLLLASSFYLSLALGERPDGVDEFLLAADEQPADFVVSAALQALGVLLIAPVLVYLYRATRHRRPQVPQVALVLAIMGPLLVAGLGVARQLDFLDTAHRFADVEAAAAAKERGADPGRQAGGQADRDTRGAAQRKEDREERAEDFVRDEGSRVLGGVYFGGVLALGLGVLLVSLNAMRAGLLSRFMGILGIIIGVLYGIQLLGNPVLLQLFWLGALASLLLGRWPGGRGPAWEAGEAIPWPSGAELRAARQATEPDDTAVAETSPGDSLAREEPDSGSPKRKRKRRR